MRAVLTSLLAALLTACEPAIALPPLPPPAPPAPPAPAAIAPTTITALPVTPPAPWAIAYERLCRGSITRPVLSPDGREVSSCGARFSVDRGRSLGPAPLGVIALLGEGRALVLDYAEVGLAVVDGDAQKLARVAGAIVTAATSADGSRVVSLEKGPQGARLVIVRELPSLKEIRRTSIGPGPTVDVMVGFLGDGREIALARRDCVPEDCTDPEVKKRHPQASCTRFACADAALLVLDEGRPRPLAPSLTKLRAVALGARGDVAAIVREGGRTSVVALPSGAEIAPLPDEYPEPSAIAVSPSGDRVAVGVDGKLVIHAQSGAGFVLTHTMTRAFTHSLAFSADGRTLFAGDHLAVLREGAAARALPDLPWEVTPPPGFVRYALKGGEMVAPTDPSDVWPAPPHVIAMYREADHEGIAVASQIDPDELDPAGDARTWARRAAARLFPMIAFDLANKGESRIDAWGEPGARAAEIRFGSDDGDPEDNVYRLQEKGGGVYLVQVKGPPALPKKLRARWWRAFVEAPLGEAPKRAAPPAKVSRSKSKKTTRKGKKRGRNAQP